MFKRLLNEFLLGINEGAVSLKYSHTEETKNNWGDKLNPYLFEKITGKKVVHCSNLLNIGFHTNISFIGSVLDRNTYKNLVVCGSGFKSSNSSMKHLPKQVFWTRGPKTREQLLKLGYKNNIPSIYGDPALLMPLFFSSQIDVNRKRSKLGIIPHYVDINNNFITKICSQPDIKLIRITQDVETFIDEILECEFIASSSLHGLIASDSYGIPNVRLKISDQIIGGDFKFEDYYEGVSISKKCIRVNENTTVHSIIDSCIYSKPQFDSNYMINSLKSL